MRIPKYLSPSNISKFFSNRDEWYLSYLAEHRPPRIPQSKPMAIGSAFDAYWKSYMVEKLFGKGSKPEFELDTIFIEQVEEQNRDWAKENGKYLFEAYRLSGALASLMIELEQASYEPRFEFTLQDTIQGVILLGKPDLYFITKGHNHVIYDAKVNGYCSKSNTSPKPGYIMCRDGWKEPFAKHSRTHGKWHAKAHLMTVSGLVVNIAVYLEDIEEHWATQLATYAWLLGEKIGSDFIVGIEQLVGKGTDTKYPLIRVASHRLRISEGFQEIVFKKYQHVWNILTQDNDDEIRELVFDDLTKEESAERCLVLDDYYKAYTIKETDTKEDRWFRSITRGESRYPY